MNLGKCAAYLFVVILTLVAGFNQAHAEARLKETVTPFAIPKGDAPDRMISLNSLAVSPDSRHIAYVARNAGKYFVVLDGNGQKPYDDIAQGTPIFRPDSKNLVYGARKGDLWYVVSGSQESKGYDKTSVPLISNDSKRVAYVAAEEGKGKTKTFAVIDGKEQKAYDGIVMNPNSLTFSLDSSRFAYIAAKDKKMFVVCDGAEGKAYDQISAMIFTDDSKHLVYVAKDNTSGKECVIFDGKETEKHERVMLYLASYDSKRLVYIAQENKKWFAVLDGKRGPSYDNMSVPRFSPDSSQLLYTASAGNKKMALIVNDKQLGQAYDQFSFITYSPDSAHMYAIATRDKKWHLLTDGVEGKAYDAVTFPVFSHDGKHIAYVAKKGDKNILIMDNKEGPAYDGILPPLFSPDSNRTLCITLIDKKCRAVVDGKPDPREYELITKPVFSHDSKHYAYMASKGNKWVIVIDGIEGKEAFIGFIKGSDLVPTPDNRFLALGIRPGPNFVKLEAGLNQ